MDCLIWITFRLRGKPCLSQQVLANVTLLKIIVLLSTIAEFKYLPAKYILPKEPEALPEDEPEELLMARLMYDHDGMADDELSLKTGDVVELIEDTGDFWICEYGDRRGKVQGNYLEILLPMQLGWEEVPTEEGELIMYMLSGGATWDAQLIRSARHTFLVVGTRMLQKERKRIKWSPSQPKRLEPQMMMKTSLMARMMMMLMEETTPMPPQQNLYRRQATATGYRG